jgi:BNR/Asp-box repeat.
MNIRSTKAIFSRFAVLAAVAILLSVSVFPHTDGNVITDPEKFSSWEIVGPSGGDVRVVTIDPRDKDRLYVSTLDGQIHTSADGGKTWRLLVNLNQPQLILDQLLVDSRDSNIIYTSGHRYKSPGGFFRTTDGGTTWRESKELRNESIHAMTQSAKDPNMLIIGTLTGIWISKNSGEDWEKVSSSTMPVNIDTLTMDPRNTSTMYAGTWWRAYKTTDEGKNWRLIKDGMIDDSDVFAVTLDPRDPGHIIASACSGIYESTNAGEKWAKIQGIPSQSRRTRDIVQHPTIPGTIYAATTEGFWMTTNGGKSWILTTQRNLEINSIAVHPDAPNRVFIGTNNYGVMVSNDGGRNFVPTNDNFTSRFAYSMMPDVERHDRLYAITHNTATVRRIFLYQRRWRQDVDTGKKSRYQQGFAIYCASEQDRAEHNVSRHQYRHL